ncbi:hypothetical protein ACHAPT_013525 [Fusarium lateritium]
MSFKRAQRIQERARELGLVQTSQHDQDLSSIKVENCVGFTKVPLGLAGPVRIVGPGVDERLYAPLATYEATLVASCSRGCKAFDASGGLQFDVFGDGMSRGPVFMFKNPSTAIAFYRAIPTLQDEFAKWAKSTSRFVRLKELRPSVIGSNVHLFCCYSCGDAAGQNMVTKATSYACGMLRKKYADEYAIKDFLIEGQLASDKKPSWGNVKDTRGVEAMAWGKITPASCEKILGLETERLHSALKIGKEGEGRSGQFGSNINTANIIAAMFIALGQDAASVGEASWSQLVSELDKETGNLTISLYFPSLPVGIVGGGTGYSTQKEALNVIGCLGPGKKHALAGIIASFALALDVSTLAAVSNNTFSDAHMRFARGEARAKL